MKRGLLYINNRFFVRIALKYQDEFVEYFVPKYPTRFVRDGLPHIEDDHHILRFVHVGQGYYHTHVDDKIAVIAFPITCGHPGCNIEAKAQGVRGAGTFYCKEHFFDQCDK